jgi:hypothetical protein
VESEEEDIDVTAMSTNGALLLGVSSSWFAGADSFAIFQALAIAKSLRLGLVASSSGKM